MRKHPKDDFNYENSEPHEMAINLGNCQCDSKSKSNDLLG